MNSSRGGVFNKLAPTVLATHFRTAYRRLMKKLVYRPRRLRRSHALRNLVRETQLSVHDFVLPLFISERVRQRRPIASMPGVFQLSVKEVADEARAAQDLGLQAVLLFGIPEQKDEQASGAYAETGIVQTALRAIKSKCPDLVTITDVCLCEYMSHGHCGVTHIEGNHFRVLNDETVELLARTALSHAAAGADIVAPSDMMDGRVGAIREALDARGFDQTAIMSYAAKFASAFYGPFREAAERPLSCLAEWSVESRRKLGRVTHDGSLIETSGIERLANRTDAAVHHVAWRHDIRASCGVRERRPRQQLNSLVVENAEMISLDVCHTTMAMTHVLAQADVGNRDKIRTF